MKTQLIFNMAVSLAAFAIASASVFAQGRSQQLTKCVSFGGNGFSPIYTDKTLKQAFFSMTYQDTAFVDKQEGDLLFVSQYEGVNFIVNGSRGRNQSPPGTSNPRRGWVQARGLEDLSEYKCRSLWELATVPEPAVCQNLKTQTQISNCAAATYKQADRRLNEVYKQVISKLNRRDREKLIDQQLAWIQRRDPTCKNKVLSTERVTETASLYPTYLNSCLETLTQQRTAELEKYLQN